MKRSNPSKRSQSKSRPPALAKRADDGMVKRASIFRNGSNQAVRLPQELRFPNEVKEVRIRKRGDSLVISPLRPDWASFFAIAVSVPDDFLNNGEDSPPQPRDPL